MTLLSELLPEYDFGERHAVAVDAPPERVFDAVRAVTLRETPVALGLVRLRGIKASADRPILEGAMPWFRVLAEERDRELVLGSVGQPWKLRGGDRHEWEDSPPRGYAKMVVNFAYDGHELSTETRVALTDEASRRKFRRYWLAIRPFSGLIRRLWLRAIKRRAEGVR